VSRKGQETMNTGCDAVETIVGRWEADGEIGGEEYLALTSHLNECPSCRRRYSAVLPFIARDAGDTTMAAALPVEPSEEFSQAVMDRVTARDRTLSARLPRLVQGRMARLAGVAAAIALLLSGVVLFYGYRTNAQRTEVVVHFVLDAPGAREVALVGSFTGWDPSRLLLKRDAGTSRWEITVPLERGRTYLYNFVINGKTWIPDPTSDVQISDGFGGESSLIQL
jgi:hypothetical protein